MRLLIYKVNQIGDSVVFLPVIQWLRNQMPELEVTLFTSVQAAPLYAGLMDEGQLHAFDKNAFNTSWKHPLRLLSMVNVSRSVRPDACYLASDQGTVASLIAAISGAGVRVGCEHTQIRATWTWTHEAASERDAHEAVKCWSVLRETLRAMGFDKEASLMPAFPPAPDFSHLLEQDSPERKPARIVIHPGASREYQLWPIQRYVELAKRLSSDFEVHWVSRSLPEEEILPESVQRFQPDRLDAFVQLLASASLFVGNNSSGMNFAAALGIPSVIINGPSAWHWDPIWHRDRFDMLRDGKAAPCQPCDTWSGPKNVCLNTTSPLCCLLRWSVDEVEARVRRWHALTSLATAASE
jgi:ADP-heptose:LPS heptosyltransferase